MRFELLAPTPVFTPIFNGQGVTSPGGLLGLRARKWPWESGRKPIRVTQMMWPKLVPIKATPQTLGGWGQILADAFNHIALGARWHPRLLIGLLPGIALKDILKDMA